MITKKDTVKLSVKVTPEFNDTIERLAETLAHDNKSELFRKAIRLLEIYEREHKRDSGIELALVKDGEVDARLVM